MDFKTEKKGYNRGEVDAYIMRLVKNYEQAAAKQSALIDELKAKLDESEKKNRAYKDKESLVSKAITSAVAKADEIERLSQLKYRHEMQQLEAFHDKWLSYYNKILKKYPLDAELVSAGKFNEEMSRILEKARLKSKQEAPSKPEPEKTAPAESESEEETKDVKETRIGYTVIDSAETEEGAGDELDDFMLKDFDPVDRIRTYLTKEHGKKPAPSEKRPAETDKKKDPQTSAKKDYADRSESGFSFEEALHPEEDLEAIMRDLGLLLDE